MVDPERAAEQRREQRRQQAEASPAAGRAELERLAVEARRASDQGYRARRMLALFRAENWCLEAIAVEHQCDLVEVRAAIDGVLRAELGVGLEDFILRRDAERSRARQAFSKRRTTHKEAPASPVK